MIFFKDSATLAQALQQIIALPDYLRATYRMNLQFLADLVHYNARWVVMSPEELIVRNHYDNFCSIREPKARAVDVFTHENLFIQLGLAPNVKQSARYAVMEAVKNLIEAGILKTDTGSDGQCDFLMTRLVDPKLSLDGAVDQVRERINKKR